MRGWGLAAMVGLAVGLANCVSHPAGDRIDFKLELVTSTCEADIPTAGYSLSWRLGPSERWLLSFGGRLVSFDVMLNRPAEIYFRESWHRLGYGVSWSLMLPKVERFAGGLSLAVVGESRDCTVSWNVRPLERDKLLDLNWMRLRTSAGLVLDRPAPPTPAPLVVEPARPTFIRARLPRSPRASPPSPEDTRRKEINEIMSWLLEQ
jgi:hypothetical protein